jgi:transposase
VAAVGVDETAYLRANATRSTTFATGVADLTPGRPARLLDVVEGRSGSVLATWLADRDSAWRAGITTASLVVLPAISPVFDRPMRWGR